MESRPMATQYRIAVASMVSAMTACQSPGQTGASDLNPDSAMGDTEVIVDSALQDGDTGFELDPDSEDDELEETDDVPKDVSETVELPPDVGQETEQGPDTIDCDTCNAWTSTCSGGSGYRVCVPDEGTGCSEPGLFVACAAGNACDEGVCRGGCLVPEIMLVVDRSSSMLGPLWTFTREEIIAFADDLAPGVRFGIRTFPGSVACDPGSVTALGVDAAAAIAAALVEPAAASATPIAKSLDGLSADFGDPNQGELVILITDGSETCSDTDETLRAARQLRARGTRVEVIGVGASWDRVLLGDVAAEGGGSVWDAPSRTELRAALRQIAATSTGCAQPAEGANACLGGLCARTACGDGRHVCDGACVDDEDPNTCGDRCEPCPAPSGAEPTCDGDACGWRCRSGFHLCGSSCVDNGAVATCGDRCTACPDPPNAYPTCDGVSCGFACDPGSHLCAGACVSNTSVATCGTRCSPCPGDPYGTATCDGTSCGVMCQSGYHACDGVCAANTAIASCGTSCTPCTPPPNATATCDGTRCGFTCQPGYAVCRDDTGCCKWQVEDIPGATINDRHNYLSVDSDNAPHGILRSHPNTMGPAYVRKTANSWTATPVLTPDREVPMVSATFDSARRPVVVWATATELGLSRRNGQGAWEGVVAAEDVEDLERSPVVIGANQVAHVLYKGCDTAACTTWSWFHRSVSSGLVMSGRTQLLAGAATFEHAASIALGSGDEPCVAIAKPVVANGSSIVHFGCRSGGLWSVTPLPTSPTAANERVFPLAFGVDGVPHILRDPVGGGVDLYDRFRRTNGTWTETLFNLATREASLASDGTRLLGAFVKLDGTIGLTTLSNESWTASSLPAVVGASAVTLGLDLHREPILWIRTSTGLTQVRWAP